MNADNQKPSFWAQLPGPVQSAVQWIAIGLGIGLLAQCIKAGMGGH